MRIHTAILFFTAVIFFTYIFTIYSKQDAQESFGVSTPEFAGLYIEGVRDASLYYPLNRHVDVTLTCEGGGAELDLRRDLNTFLNH